MKGILLVSPAAAIALVVSFGAATLAVAQEPNRVAIYYQFIDHLNAGEIEDALALLTDDAFFPPDRVGIPAVREELENRRAINTQMTVHSVDLVNDHLEISWSATNDCLAASGIDSLSGTSIVEFAGDRISAGIPSVDLGALSDEQLAQLAEASMCAAAGGLTLPAGGTGYTPGQDHIASVAAAAMATLGVILLGTGWIARRRAVSA